MFFQLMTVKEMCRMIACSTCIFCGAAVWTDYCVSL